MQVPTEFLQCIHIISPLSTLQPFINVGGKISILNTYTMVSQAISAVTNRQVTAWVALIELCEQLAVWIDGASILSILIHLPICY